jgi:hypothetical protein
VAFGAVALTCAAFAFLLAFAERPRSQSEVVVATDTVEAIVSRWNQAVTRWPIRIRAHEVEVEWASLRTALRCCGIESAHARVVNSAAIRIVGRASRLDYLALLTALRSEGVEPLLVVVRRRAQPLFVYARLSRRRFAAWVDPQLLRGRR